MYYARAGSSGPFAQFANWRGPRTPIPPPGVSPLCLSLRRYTYTRAAAAVFVRVPLRVCVYTRLCERSRSLDLYRPLSIFCNLLFEKSAQRTNSKAAREREARKKGEGEYCRRLKLFLCTYGSVRIRRGMLPSLSLGVDLPRALASVL